MSENGPSTAAIYARVSTADQDVGRQLDEAREHLEGLGVDDVKEYPEVVSGAADTREVYNELLDDVETGRFDLVVVHEISRLSRLGPTEIHEFIQHCLEHDTGVEALDVGLKIHVDDGELQQTIYSMIARLMGDLAQIEHTQKLQRIRSGVRAAQNAGKWTGRPPAGFVVEDGYLRVDPAEFLHIREAVTRVDRGEPYAEVAEDTGIPESTLRNLEGERREMYLAGNADDDRVDDALDDVRPLGTPEDLDRDDEQLRERVERLEEELDL
ncbi:Resolvase domain-containing protein [Halorubrum distributum JCM 9100]|uniref:Resolvase domain-containing protein n=1 Tax=Halorubrum distributum JCM 9100 TaxID=1227467 RepID=M0F3C5_9EURY|nr:recombinase family protein [Halorubrum distributum]ELZ53149.1 Resolvase domain-containing protein [Halorubrum distributum JCM 9100]